MNRNMFLFIALCLVWYPSMTIAQSDGRGQDIRGLVSEESRVDKIYADERRLVIGDQEMHVRGDVMVNGQMISGSALLSILRENQSLRRVLSERSGPDQKLYLREVQF